MTKEEAINILCMALNEADKKHSEWYSDIIHCAAVLNEEAGEAIKAALNYTYEDSSLDDFIYEVAQSGAMAIKILMNLPQDHLPKKFKQYKEPTKEEIKRIKTKSLEWLHNLDSDDQNELEETKEEINTVNEIDNTKSCVDGLGHVYITMIF